jgi:hypothetical protein
MDNFDSWLESGADDGLDDQDLINDEITRLMKEENNPDLYHNFIEAISEDCLSDHKDALEEALAQDDKQKVGLIISSSVFVYWEDKSEKEA